MRHIAMANAVSAIALRPPETMVSFHLFLSTWLAGLFRLLLGCAGLCPSGSASLLRWISNRVIILKKVKKTRRPVIHFPRKP